MPGWHFLLWQGGALLIYGTLGVITLFLLEERDHISPHQTTQFLDWMMVPFYAGAGVAANVLVTPVVAATTLSILEGLGAAYLLACGYRSGRVSKRRRAWTPPSL
jgi:hypothetical protein